MKLLDKLKNMFTEEVEETRPIKKDVIQVEIPAPSPKREEIENEEESKKEEKPVPIFFDDKDFNDLEPSKKKVEMASKSKAEVKLYGAAKVSFQGESKRLFKPTPIISPVYGVLDKNYYKEDIVNKPKTVSYKNPNVTIDDVRKKAYGTLEDDLEKTLTKTSIFYNEEVETEKIPPSMDIFDELEAKINKKKEETSDEFNLLDNEPITEDLFEEATDNLIKEIESDEKISDSDLFNLIDSMYERDDTDDVNDN